ncbi:unnamed protein product (macronuclear) [Paramecium tetraurelia]|uniref:Phosphoribosyltransferase domain-containing protein n=1 Tax=Paramecium tetraurelia TaxID=5888 RepID=A0CHP2_PARTE|nr:uncharacterized protein GSPATT00038411001 [Paramecium tetraurelia]CAK70309.1 unnamed protein product [Paramecium tetraurelia]|eukprot:XP_001437706.1 hypothetical protein (macronuclear) [Paramecium tetraurelia strain d4-2]
MKMSLKQQNLGIHDPNELKLSDQEYIPFYLRKSIVSILRSGNAFLNESLRVTQGASIGQILIQGNEKTSMPMYSFEKLPENINEQQIILVDSILEIGASASMALRILQKYGVKEENIIFLTLVSCEQGLNKVFKEFPNIKIITAQFNPKLINDVSYCASGIEDFGDRYFGTVKKLTCAERFDMPYLYMQHINYYYEINIFLTILKAYKFYSSLRIKLRQGEFKLYYNLTKQAIILYILPKMFIQQSKHQPKQKTQIYDKQEIEISKDLQFFD